MNNRGHSMASADKAVETPGNENTWGEGAEKAGGRTAWHIIIGHPCPAESGAAEWPTLPQESRLP